MERSYIDDKWNPLCSCFQEFVSLYHFQTIYVARKVT